MFPHTLNGPAFLGFMGGKEKRHNNAKIVVPFQTKKTHKKTNEEFFSHAFFVLLEVNIHGVFRFNFSQSKHTTRFTLNADSVLRFSSFSSKIDHSVWIYAGDSKTGAIVSDGGVGVEQAVAQRLVKGDYRMEIALVAGIVNACEVAVMQLSVVPVLEYQRRIGAADAQLQCSNTDKWPKLVAFNPQEPHWVMVEATDLFFRTPATVPAASSPFLYQLNFTVPGSSDQPGTWWRLHAELGLDFTSSGSVGFLLRNTASPVDLHAPCLSDDDCLQAPLLLPGRRVVDRLLSGGDYQLVIFDNSTLRLTSSPQCTPFSLMVRLDREIEAESFLSCPGSPLPTSLNEPGFLTTDGYLFVDRNFVLDGSVSKHNITFSLGGVSASLFRLLIAEHSAVDIDVRLFAPNGTAIVSGTQPRPVEENLVAVLVDPGDYRIEISYWGQFAVSACETFRLVVAMAPESAAHGYCAGVTQDFPLQVPDPSDDLNTGDSHSFGFWSDPIHPITYVNRSQLYWKLADIRVDSTVTNARILVRVGQDFLLANLHVTLHSENSQRALTADPKGHFVELSEFLEPGFYTLAIQPGGPAYASGSFGDVVGKFPSCVRFSFQLNMTADPVNADPIQRQGCWEWPELPTTLQQPQFLDNPSRQMYMWGRFATPPNNFDDRVIHFTGGAVPSLLRAYVDPHEDDAVDLDLILREDGQLVASSIGLAGKAEQVVWTLKSNSSYDLMVRVYQNRMGQVCDSFGFEMAVEPVPTALWSGPCGGSERTPPADWIPTTAPDEQWPWSRSEVFSFTESLGSRRSFDLNVTLSQAAFLRVRASYEFVWGALAITLQNGNGDWIQDSNGGGNTNNLGTIRLDPGSYRIHLEHSGIPLPDGSAAPPTAPARCVSFALHASIDAATDGDQQVGPHGAESPCLVFPFPATWNAPWGLHPLTANQLHLSRHVLIKSSPPSGDQVTFTVTVDSIFRVYVPFLTNVDVDLELDQLSGPSSTTTTTIFSTLGRGEESRVRHIGPGNYVFKTRYYQAIGGSALPPTRACGWFPLQVAIVPLTLVSASPASRTGANCVNSDPPPVLVPPMAGTALYGHSVTGVAPWSRNVSIVVDMDSTLSFALEADFGTGPIWAKVVSRDNADIVLWPVMGVSRAFFFQTLRAGTWDVMLSYPKGDDTAEPPAAITCNSFMLYHRLELGVQSSGCILDPFPADVFRHQDAQTGAFRYYDQNLRAPRKGTKAYVLFNVTVASMWRLHTESVGSTVVDLDFNLYNSTKAANSTYLVKSSRAGGKLEDLRAWLPPLLHDSYMVELVTYSIRHQTDVDCPSITLYMASQPVTEVLQDRLCPASPNVNLPPTEITFAPGSVNGFPPTSYTIDQVNLAPFLIWDRWAWSFDISLEVRENTTLQAQVASEFLAYDATLSLSPHGTSITTMATPDSGAKEDFFVRMETLLSPGLYKLTVSGPMNDALWTGEAGEASTRWCLRFSLDITGTSLDIGIPRIISVSPGSSVGINPVRGLSLVIHFDHLIDVPAAASIQNDVKSQALISLTQKGSASRIAVTSCSMSASRTVLYVHFGGLVHDQVYTLNVVAGGFQSNGTPFQLALEESSYTYAMQSCQCKNGVCNNATGLCVCNSPAYTGANCSSCAHGYHGFQDQCIADVPCPANFCGAYGNCSTPQGSPVCTCLDGYVSSGSGEGVYCDACAVGFDGFPNCQLVAPDSISTCGLPLLPNSFDGPGGLSLDGTIHLAGRYYLDLVAQRHPIRFTLQQQSVVRVYVEPHAADVDVALRVDLGDGTFGIFDVAGSYTFAREEVIFTVVPPGRYGLIFSYWSVNSAAFGPCESAAIEIAIRPAADVRSGDNNNAAACSAHPAVSTVFPWNSSKITLAEGQNFYHRPAAGDHFAAIADPSAGNRRVLGQVTFVVPYEVAGAHSNRRAFLTAELSYRFISGDLGLMLVHGYASFDDCATVGHACLPGTNGYDRNTINSQLDPQGGSSYTLYVYEPVAQNTSLSACSLFDLSLSVEWRSTTVSDALGCAGARMPDELLQSGYAEHWSQVVALSNAAENTTLAVGLNGGRLRVSISLHDAGVPSVTLEGLTLTLYRDDTLLPVESSFVSPGHPVAEIATVLSAGRYTLSLQMNQYLGNEDDETLRCRFVNVELAFLPTAAPTVPQLGCPAAPSLPQLPTPMPVPFTLPSHHVGSSVPVTYFAFVQTDAQVFEIPLTLTEECIVSAHLWSAFLPAHAVMRIRRAGELRSQVTSVSHYNDARFEATRLAAGSWLLEVSFVKPDAQYLCLPFHFSFSLHTLRSVEAATVLTSSSLATLRCSLVTPGGVDYFPRTLNSWRYLLYDGSVDFHSERLLIPVQAQTTSSVEFNTTFSVRTASVLTISRSVNSWGAALRHSLVSSDNNTVIAASNEFGVSAVAYVLQPNVNYQVNWTAVNWNADPVIEDGAAPWCLLATLHFSIKPLPWGTLDTAACTNGASRFPQDPLIPASLGVPSAFKGSFYSVGQGLTYFVAQSADEKAKQQYTFTLDRISNILVDLRYDSTFLRLGATLQSKGAAAGAALYHQSIDSATGSTLLLNGIRPGTYSLTLADALPTSVDSTLFGCRPFTFRMVVEEDLGAVTAKLGAPPLPESLNDIGYLGYESSGFAENMHWAHIYQMRNVHLQQNDQWAASTNLTVTTTSVMRIAVRLSTVDRRDKVPMLQIADLTDASKTWAPQRGTPDLLVDYTLLPRHNYVIRWSAVLAHDAWGMLPSQDLLVYVEVSIRDVNALHTAIASQPLYSVLSCPTQSPTLPTVELSQTTGEYLYSNDALKISVIASQQMGTVAATSFTLDEPETVIYAVLEVQFALSHIVLSVATADGKRTVPFTRDLNRQFIHEVLPAGNYTLSLVNSWLQDQPEAPTLAHCGLVSLHLQLRSTWAGAPSHTADCSSFDLLPSDLSRPDGGSAEYGGPMDSKTGAVSVYGDHFLYPEVSAGSPGYGFVEFSTESQKTLLVMVYFHLGATSSMSWLMGEGGAAETDFGLMGWDEMGVPFLAPSYAEDTAHGYRLEAFRLEEAKGAMVEMDFTLIPQGLGTCPYYEFAFHSMEATQLANTLLCTTAQSDVLKQKPVSAPQLDPVNQTYFEHSWGAISTVGPKFAALGPVTITVTQMSVVHYALSLNGFVSRGFVNVTEWDMGPTRVLPAVEEHSHNSRVEGTQWFLPGTYSIQILVERLADTAGLVNERGQTQTGAPLCMPWAWDLWVAPYLDTGVIRVVGVSPAEMHALRPGQDLYLDITVTDPLYCQSGDCFMGTNNQSSPATHDALAKAFTLVSRTDASQAHGPDRVRSNGYGESFTFIWKAGTLLGGTSYLLQLRHGILGGPHRELVLERNYTYTMVKADYCGVHGTLNAAGFCECTAGWGGTDCSVCAIGYAGPSCQATTDTVCMPSTCGLDNFNSPLGVCDDSVQPPKCTCHERYVGAHCELCADASQQASYPVCTVHPIVCPQACVHGLCDQVVGQCSCLHHWSGVACDECPPRFMGANCEMCSAHFSGPSCESCYGGWQGDLCDKCPSGWSGTDCDVPPKSSDVLRWGLIAVVVLVVVLVALVAVMAIRRYKQKQEAHKEVFAMSQLGGLDDGGDNDFFDDTLDQVPQGASLLSNSEFNLRLSDDEDADF